MLDVLSDVLSVTRLGTTVVAHAELLAPWGLEVDPVAEAHVHVVQRGVCWLRTSVDRRPLRLGTGDVVLIRGGVGHSISDDPKTAPAPYKEVLAAMPRRLARATAVREHEITRVLCAQYMFQHVGPHPLTSLLPPLIHLPSHEAERHLQLQLVLQLLRHEATDPESGTELVIPRLVDSLLVFIIRAWLDEQPRGAGGWFGALRDPSIAKALSLIHDQPQSSWTVESLARRVSQSRATFARRFSELVGETPVAYLTRWRMCLATKLLSETALPLDAIADRVGYETAAAFSKAFRRIYAMAPGRFRDDVGPTGTAAPPIRTGSRRTDKSLRP